MDTKPKLEILIVGGGIAGAACALFLERLADTHTTVLEARPHSAAAAAISVSEGSTLMLGPNGMRVLHALGLADGLLARPTALPVTDIAIGDTHGGIVGRIPQGCVARHGFASTATSRGDVHAVLCAALSQARRVDVRRGARVDGVTEAADGVHVCWTEDGEQRERTVDLVIGADGIWSGVRPSLYRTLGLVAPEPTYSGLVGIGFTLDVDAVTGLSGFLGLEQPVVMLQDRLGFVGMMLFDKEAKKVAWWTTHEADERSRERWRVPREQTFRELRERYAGCAFPVPQLINASEASTEEALVWPVHEVEKLGKWHSNRIVLIGDAAHAMPPHSGQGASQALEDAAYLAHLLRQYLRESGESLSLLLDTYQKVRQPRVDEMVREANRRGDTKRETSWLGMFVRRWMLRVMILLMTQRWLDGWFAYKVPGIDEWIT